MSQPAKTLRKILHPDHLVVAALTVLVLWVLLGLIHAIKFLDPVEKVIESMSMVDVYYRISNSGTPEVSRDITLVDITDLSERQRDSIAIVIEDVLAMQPDVVGVDVIFGRELIDSEADAALRQVFYDAAADSSVVVAMKLTSPDARTHAFSSAVHSFFVGQLMDRRITEGCTNVVGEPEMSITKYPVYLKYGDDSLVYSLPALMTRALTGKDVTPDRDGQHTVSYRGLRFPVVDYRHILENERLIRSHKVLIGSTREETDMHLTPLGRRSGLEVVAYTLDSMVEGDHVWWGGPFWVFIVALLGGAVMNVIDYFVTRPIHRARPAWLRFLAESEIYAKVLAFLWMVVFTGITYAVYAYGHKFVDTWLALATIAFIEEGRLIYKALLTVVKARFGEKSIAKSIYADDVK